MKQTIITLFTAVMAITALANDVALPTLKPQTGDDSKQLLQRINEAVRLMQTNGTITADQYLDFTNRLEAVESAVERVESALTNGSTLSVSSPLPVVGSQGRHIVTIPVHRGSANTVGTAAAPPIEIPGVAISSTNSAMISSITLISGDTITNNVKLLFSLYSYPEWPGTNQAVNLASSSLATNPFVSITTSNTAAGHWEKFGSNVFWTMDAGYRCLPVNASNSLVLSVVKDGEEIETTNDMILVIDTLKN